MVTICACGKVASMAVIQVSSAPLGQVMMVVWEWRWRLAKRAAMVLPDPVPLRLASCRDVCRREATYRCMRDGGWGTP